jgi:Trk K+ transport system NAD-binding subunit
MGDKPLYLIVGWDDAARQAVKSLLALGMDAVILSPQAPSHAPPGARVVLGHPCDPQALRQAGSDRAAGVLAALPAEEAGRAIAAARKLNPSIHVVASIQEADSKTALWAAGAHEVVDAREETGREMVRVMLSETDAATEDEKIYWSRLRVPAGSVWTGLRLVEVRGRLRSAAVACVWTGGDPTKSREDDDVRVAPGDVLILLGGRAQLSALLRRAE